MKQLPIEMQNLKTLAHIHILRHAGEWLFNYRYNDNPVSVIGFISWNSRQKNLASNYLMKLSGQLPHTLIMISPVIDSELYP